MQNTQTLTKQHIEATHYDIIIAGGGVIGCSAAIAIANESAKAQGRHTHTYKIAIVEAHKDIPRARQDPNTRAALNTGYQSTQHPSFDARVVALAEQSYQQLIGFGVEVDDAAVDMCPIQHIHVSDKGRIGQTQLHTPDDSAALGYVVALEQLGKQLLNQVDAHPSIDYFAPSRIQDLEQTQTHINITTSDGQQLSAALLLIAEGANSSTKQHLNIKNTVEQYGQTAIITNIKTQVPHCNWAYERFTAQGPIAFLPMNLSLGSSMSNKTGGQMSVVWTINTDKVDEIMTLPKADFLQKLQGLFSDKLGKFTECSQPVSYPLSLTTAQRYTHHRVICLGNAAQSLHPIAGQGFNLGVRDIKALVDVLFKHTTTAANKIDSACFDDLGGYKQIQAYCKLRDHDKSAVIAATDSLVRLFSNHHLPLVIGRNLGLIGLNNSHTAKSLLTRFAMGER